MTSWVQMDSMGWRTVSFCGIGKGSTVLGAFKFNVLNKVLCTTRLKNIILNMTSWV